MSVNLRENLVMAENVLFFNVMADGVAIPHLTKTSATSTWHTRKQNFNTVKSRIW